MRTRMFIAAALGATAIVGGAAVPTDAATTHTWDRIAGCESGHRWHINTGNGYYGGLQISPSTWRSHGGKRFARLPNHATKGEQINVAEKIKRDQGWGAWPVCSRKAGVRH